MVDDRTLWLRVKRPHSESPVECFNAIPSKRIRRSAESLGFTRFKYLGTSSSPADSTGISLEDLKDMGASGERKIILGRKNAAHIVDSSENAMQCEVRISETQCKGIKRKADTFEECDDPTTKSPPNKSIRIIDLSVKDQAFAISSALDELKMGSKQNSNGIRGECVSAIKEADDNESGFLYDLYAISPDADNNVGPSFYAEDSDEFDKHLYGNDDSDSNSESNWRNDYPDEDDLIISHSSGESSDESFLSVDYAYRQIGFFSYDL